MDILPPLKELLAYKHNTRVELETQTQMAMHVPPSATTKRNEHRTICVRKIFYIHLVIACKIMLTQLIGLHEQKRVAKIYKRKLIYGSAAVQFCQNVQ
jgi:hypothetical protein